MQNEEQTTQEKILCAAKAEFLKKGFQTASLRAIVKAAGVTTGALYGYYSSKEALFDALVEESYTHLLSAFRNVLDDFSRLPIEQQPERMGTVSQACMEELLLYMFNHREAFHLLLLCSEGTRYSSMKEELGPAGGQCHPPILSCSGKAGNARSADRPQAGAYSGYRDDKRLF